MRYVATLPTCGPIQIFFPAVVALSGFYHLTTDCSRTLMVFPIVCLDDCLIDCLGD